MTGGSANHYTICAAQSGYIKLTLEIFDFVYTTLEPQGYSAIYINIIFPRIIL